MLGFQYFLGSAACKPLCDLFESSQFANAAWSTSMQGLCGVYVFVLCCCQQMSPGCDGGDFGHLATLAQSFKNCHACQLEFDEEARLNAQPVASTQVKLGLERQNLIHIYIHMYSTTVYIYIYICTRIFYNFTFHIEIVE